MKGRKHHKHRDTGGANEAEADLKEDPADRSRPGPGGPKTGEENVGKEAREKKHGGKVKRHKRKLGGKIVPHTGGKIPGKEVGVVEGPEPPRHAGRKPRASGGKTGRAGSGSDKSPLSSAAMGKAPTGHKQQFRVSAGEE